jgi:Fur family iron response transcriptional regulator
MVKTVSTQMVSSDDLAQRLAGHDILPTQQRLQIADVLFCEYRHLSADQVLSEANARGYSVSKATVYNTLGLFARKGLIREVIVDPSRVFYDPNTGPHHHFYNLDTGELIDLDPERLPIHSLPPLPPGTIAEGVDVIIRVRNQ